MPRATQFVKPVLCLSCVLFACPLAMASGESIMLKRTFKPGVTYIEETSSATQEIKGQMGEMKFGIEQITALRETVEPASGKDQLRTSTCISPSELLTGHPPMGQM